MLRLTRDAAERGPGSFSTMKQVMPSGVRAASATMPERSPLVTHILVPSMTYSSPSGVALQRSALRVAARVRLATATARRASRRSPSAAATAACWSAVPCWAMSVAAIMWVLSTPVSDIQPAASSSMMRA